VIIREVASSFMTSTGHLAVVAGRVCKCVSCERCAGSGPLSWHLNGKVVCAINRGSWSPRGVGCSPVDGTQSVEKTAAQGLGYRSRAAANAELLGDAVEVRLDRTWPDV
jgi:hypothetical protein